MTNDPTPTPLTLRTFAGISTDQMQAFRREHGQDAVKALTVPLPNGPLQVIVRKPSRHEYERHTETLMKLREGKVAQAMSANRTLVVDCTLAPTRAELVAALDEYPALADKLAEPLLALAGADAEVREETF